MCTEDVVQQAAESIKGCLDGVACLLASNKSICAELSNVLGIGQPGKEDEETKAWRSDTVTRIAALTDRLAKWELQRIRRSPDITVLRENCSEGNR
jgi:hypothetical protein